MKYGILENNKFLLIDDDAQKLRDTLMFLPQYSEQDIKTYEDSEIELNFDGNWYLMGFAPTPSEPTYAEQRAQAYPEATEQLDKLYHDINSGMFGDDAKTSEFYLARKAVKDEFPKPESDSPSTEEV